MMVVMGNGSSFLGRYTAGFYTPVANMIGVNTTWNFFSPDPAHIMYFKYIIHFEDEYGNPTQEPIEQFYPTHKGGSEFAHHVRRHNYMMRFVAIDSGRIEKYFIPWICKRNPKATKIQFEFIVNVIPSLDTVVTLKNTPYEDLIKTDIVNQGIFSCAQTGLQ